MSTNLASRIGGGVDLYDPTSIRVRMRSKVKHVTVPVTIFIDNREASHDASSGRTLIMLIMILS
jgi:hypothetical protein